MTQIAALTAPGADSAEITSFADPVFVLCNGRSGSTLLRFLLDAHPDLACPPETNLPDLCAQLATVWSLIEGAPLSVNRGDEPPEIPDAAISGIRQTMDRMVGSYLARRGKKRYCDKSLGTAQFAELLLRVYPEAKFLCLYRHPMDVIASAIEACPWGLNGYGFDPYVATTPGNAVMAVARFWVDNAAAILAVEDEFADRCLRVRYEDLVTEPESVAAQVFEFLDAAVAQRVEGRNSGPEQRGGFGIIERFRYRYQRLYRSKHVLPVSAVTADARNFQVPAIAKVSAPARRTCVVLPAMPSDADPLSDIPLGNTSIEFIDDARDLVSGNARILNARPLTFLCQHVAVANAAGLHFDAHLSHTRLGNLAFDDFEIRPRFRNLRHLHWRDCDSCCCHNRFL